MNEAEIELLFGKAWDEMYPDKTRWINMPQEAKDEWIKIVGLYENHREIYCIENAIP